MPRSFVSSEARYINATFPDFLNRLEKRYLWLDHDARTVLEEVMLQYIRELGVLLENPNVRGNLDPTMRLPVVDESSLTGPLCKRLKRQMKAICVLSDVVFIDPPANRNENDVIERARRIVDLLYDAISPPSSASGSDCATDTD